MKINKILLVLFAILLIGCTLSKQEETPKDCKCNRVVEVSSFNLADRTTFGTYITINECTGVQRQYQWQYEINKPQKGSCK